VSGGLALQLENKVVDPPSVGGKIEARRQVLGGTRPTRPKHRGTRPAVGPELDRAAAMAAFGKRHVGQ
jgi:hypothetical protein